MSVQKNIHIVIILCLVHFLWVAQMSLFASQPIKIVHITDVHYLSSALVSDGEAYETYQRNTGRNIADLHQVLDAVLEDLLNEQINVLLISGDITNHGERQSHIDFIDKLQPLQKQGTRIFVVPGNHDINIPDARAFRGDAPTPTPSVSAEEFAQLYADFGFGDALKRDVHSLSYLASINDSIWLLAFDTNRYAEHTTSSITGGRIHPETLTWALHILQKAQEKGITVLGMMHHGLVEHMPLQSTFFADYLIEDWRQTADILADAGLRLVFTGHFHSNSVSFRTSASGNTIYDVETASLAQYPFAYRIMLLKNSKLSVDTRFISSVPHNADLADEYRKKLEDITRRVAQNRLRNIGFPLPEVMQNALIDIMVKMNMLHVRGDEKPDDEMLQSIRELRELLGVEMDADESSVDFPSANNQLIIRLNNPPHHSY